MMHRVCTSSQRLMPAIIRSLSIAPCEGARFARCFSSDVKDMSGTGVHKQTPTAGRAKYKLTMYNEKISKEVTAFEGQSLLEVAQQNDIEQIEGACEGTMCCSTCHMIFDQQVFSSIGEGSEDEKDVLDLAKGVTTTSRLGCQVRVTKHLDGAKIRIPQEFINQMT